MSLDLALYENANKWLTKPETALLQLFDKEVEKKKKIMQDKLKERLIIAEAISSHESKESEDRERKQSEKDAMAPPAKKKKEEPVRKDPEISNVQIMGIMEKIYQAEAAKTSPIESSIGSSSIGDVSSASPSTTEVGTAATTTTTAIIKKKRKLEEVEDDDNESTTPVEGVGSFVRRMDQPDDGPAWNSAVEPKDACWLLPDFGISEDIAATTYNQTILLKLSVPKGSPSWSLSIAPIKSKSAVAPIISQAEEGSSSSSSSNSSTEELIVQKEPVQPTVPVHDEYLYDVLFHFNPRYRKGQLAMNDKQGTWGMLMNRKLGKTVSVEEILAAELEVMIQIRKEVYVVFVNRKFCDFFPHRRDMAPLQGHSLCLAMLAKDGNGNPQGVEVHKVWWGKRDPSLDQIPTKIQEEVAALAASSAQQAQLVVARSIVVSGLPKIMDLVELHVLESDLYGIFGTISPAGAGGEALGIETIFLPPGKGVAYVKLLDPYMIQSTIDQLDGTEIGDPSCSFRLQLSKMATSIDL